MSARVPIVELPHPVRHEREDLEIFPIGGWRVVTLKGAFRVRDRAVFIEPDYCVPTALAEFAHLASEGRVKCRLRTPLLIPLPSRLAHLNTGDNVMLALGIERYAPLIQTGARPLPLRQCPKRYSPIFGTESFNNVEIEEGSPVIITEKVHGAGGRYLFHEGRMFVGSRERWLVPDDTHVWGAALKAHPEISEWCEAHPDVLLFGEVYGNVQSLKYGRKDTVAFAGFAAITPDAWASPQALFRTLESFGVPHVPVLYMGSWKDSLLDLAEENSAVPGSPSGHMREGIVIVPDEHRSARQSNGALKYISARYWGKPLDEKGERADSNVAPQFGAASEGFLHDFCSVLWDGSSTRDGGESPRRSGAARRS